MKRIHTLVWTVGLLAGIGLAISPAATAEETVDLWKAAWEGNVEIIKQQLAAGSDVNAKAPSIGITPLMAAAVTGQGDAATLLSLSARPDIKNNGGSTALHMAAFFGHLQIVKALVARGADVNVVNDKSETPLDTVQGAWSDELTGLYEAVGDGLKLELDMNTKTPDARSTSPTSTQRGRRLQMPSLLPMRKEPIAGSPILAGRRTKPRSSTMPALRSTSIR